MARYRRVKRKKYQLYKKRKSTARKVAEAVALVVVVGGLGFVGYSAANPLINYFKNLGANQPAVTEWTPTETTPVEQTTEISEATTSEAATTAAVQSEPLSYYLPDSALQSPQALSAAVSSAKAAGNTAIFVTLKDTDGNLRYTTGIDSVEKTDLVTGTLAAAQIYGAIKGAGLTPIAVINTLYDNMTPSVIDDIAYRFADDSYTWLDARVEEGGKRWIDPFKDGAADYLSEVAAEIAKNGFKRIVLSNTLFPTFKPYDKTVLDAHFFTDDRYTALSLVASAAAEKAEAAGAEVMLEVKLSDTVNAKPSRTAELLLDKGKLSGMKIIVTFSEADFDDDIADGEETLNITADTEKYIKSLFGSAKTALSGYELTPCIDGAGLSAQTLAKIKTALGSMGYDEIIIK